MILLLNIVPYPMPKLHSKIGVYPKMCGDETATRVYLSMSCVRVGGVLFRCAVFFMQKIF